MNFSASCIAVWMVTAGTLFGLFLKEVFFVRSFERWKTVHALDQVARKYRDPIALAALELCNRLIRICDDYPPAFLDSTVLAIAPAGPGVNSADDPHFQRYRHISTVFRLCAFLGWIELYRQDTTYLEPRDESSAQRLSDAIFAIRSDLADWQLNTAREWAKWHDVLIFREEQRAIGESMIVPAASGRTVMGYAAFSNIFPAAAPEAAAKWIYAAASFVTNPQPAKDFREIRMRRLIVHLVTLVRIVTPSRLREAHDLAVSRYESAIKEAA